MAYRILLQVQQGDKATRKRRLQLNNCRGRAEASVQIQAEATTSGGKVSKHSSVPTVRKRLRRGMTSGSGIIIRRNRIYTKTALTDYTKRQHGAAAHTRQQAATHLARARKSTHQ